MRLGVATVHARQIGCEERGLFAALAGLVVGVLAVITFARSRIFPTLTTLWPVVPWRALLGMLIGMPLLCALVAIVLTPRHQKRIRRIN